MMDWKEQLLLLQHELKNRVEKIDKDLHSRMTSAKFSEQVVEGQNDEVLLNLKNEAEQELEQIEHALLKLENGRFGHCEKCHGKISEERLHAVPFATLCKKCAA
ncbi:TraR/DksA family transcriptional regulator [Aliiglaciecola sp. M165]|nr:TraR/DksA family transcriptional regulator [Aliiglaciecola sp. M165]